MSKIQTLVAPDGVTEIAPRTFASAVFTAAGTSIETENSNSVKTTAQTFTDAQKQQARTNIGAISSTDETLSSTLPIIADNLTGISTAAVGQVAKVKTIDENGVPTEWEAGDGGSLPSGGAAGDALVHDGTTWTRQSGYGYVTPATGETITWDGSTTGKTSIMDSYYLMSSNIPSISDLASTTIIEYDGNDGSTYTASNLPVYTFTDFITSMGGTITSGDGSKAYFLVDSSEECILDMPIGVATEIQTLVYTIDGNEMTTDITATGIYFYCDINHEGSEYEYRQYVQSFTYGSSEVIHLIDSKYIPASGLPTGTAAGNALIYTGSEWSQQSDYGYTINNHSGNNITWNGDTADRDKITAMGNKLYKVSELIPSASDLINSTVIAKNGNAYIIPTVVTGTQYAASMGGTVTSGDGDKLLIAVNSSSTVVAFISMLAQTITFSISGQTVSVEVPSTGIFLGFESQSNYWRTLIYGNQITWDGDISELESITMPGFGTWYKVSNQVIKDLNTVKSVVMTTTEVDSGSSSIRTFTNYWNATLAYMLDMLSATLVSGDPTKVFFITDSGCVAASENQTIVVQIEGETYTFNISAGIYLSSSKEDESSTEYEYVSNFNYYTSDELHQIDGKYTYIPIEIAAEQLELVDNYYSIEFSQSQFDLITNENNLLFKFVLDTIGMDTNSNVWHQSKNHILYFKKATTYDTSSGDIITLTTVETGSGEGEATYIGSMVLRVEIDFQMGYLSEIVLNQVSGSSEGTSTNEIKYLTIGNEEYKLGGSIEFLTDSEIQTLWDNV